MTLLLTLLLVASGFATKFIDGTGGDCSSIGTWNGGTLTCTLTTDLAETVEIDGSGITLDCDSHSITGAGADVGVFVSNHTAVTVKNCIISNFPFGVFIGISSGCNVTNNTINGTFMGVCLDYLEDPGTWEVYRSENNTVENNRLDSNHEGVSILSSAYNNITGNNITNTDSNPDVPYPGSMPVDPGSGLSYSEVDTGAAISLAGPVGSGSTGNIISGNSVLNSTSNGVRSIPDSSNNTFSDNLFDGNGAGISFSSSATTLINNNITNNGLYGIEMLGGDAVLINNIVSDNGRYGIRFGFVSNNVLINNTVSNTEGYFTGGQYIQYIPGHGIYFERGSINNNLSGNNMTGNDYNFNINFFGMPPEINGGFGAAASFENTIDATNLVEGKKIYYYEDNASVGIVPSDAGMVIALNSGGLIVQNLDFHNNSHGIVLANTDNSLIMNNTFSYANFGVYVTESDSNNTIQNNTFSKNIMGIVAYSSSDTNIVNNTLENNTFQGITLVRSSYNNVTSNTADNRETKNASGTLFSFSHHNIYLYDSSYNNVTNNTLTSFSCGAMEDSTSTDNDISGNNVTFISWSPTQSPATVLVAPYYKSSFPYAAEDTLFNVTNLGGQDVKLRVFFVRNSSYTGIPKSAFFDVNAGESAAFLASDVDPNNTGSVFVIPVNSTTGEAIAYNNLTGTAAFNRTTNHAGSYDMVGFRALGGSVGTLNDPYGAYGTLIFDGSYLEKWPTGVFTSNIPAPSDGNDMRLITMSPVNNLVQGSYLGSYTFQVLSYNDYLQRFSTAYSRPGVFSDIVLLPEMYDLRTWNALIPYGHTGVLRIRAVGTAPILGMHMNYNANLGTPCESCLTNYSAGSLQSYNITYPLRPENISFCQNIGLSGYYVLNQSIAASGDCIGIDADGVTLDCLGYNITGDGTGIGIAVDGRANISITNCNISNFSKGINLSASTGILAHSNTIHDSGYGFWLDSSDGNDLNNNTAYANTQKDIFLSSSSNNNTGCNLCAQLQDGDSNSVTCASSCATRIRSCQEITDSGDYIMDADISAPPNPACITIASDGVNLDCDGHTITGSRGISAEGYNNLTIQGCTLVDSGSIRLLGSSGSTIAHNTVSSANEGIYLLGCSNSNIIDNTVSSNQEGIYLESGSNNVLSGNRADDNYDAGIFIFSDMNDTLINNTASGNTYGVFIDPSSGNNITGNTANNNWQYGFFFTWVSESNITYNTANGNIVGFWFESFSDSNNITDNTAHNNSDTGISISWSSSNNIADNSFCTNPRDIYISSPDSAGNSGGNTCDILQDDSGGLNTVNCAQGCSVSGTASVSYYAAPEADLFLVTALFCLAVLLLCAKIPNKTNK